MQLDRIAVALRPRNEWESLDLGFQMAREWWKPIWGVWLALYLPAGAALLLAFDNKLHAVLVLWWLKPLFDRAVLHAASRAVFGETCGVAATLKSAGQWLKPGLIGALTWGRFDFARSFSIPVSTLEKQTGSAARRRRAALGARARGKGVWLTLVCLHLEGIALVASVAVVAMLVPSAAELPQVDYGSDFMAALRDMFTWQTADVLHYMIAVSLVEPFYVTAGFALYLNRRTLLEGWDIEVQLRRMEDRLRGAGQAALLAIVVALAGSGAWMLSPPQAFAQASATPPVAEDKPATLPPARKSAQQEIQEVLKGPDFGSSREVTSWRYVGEQSKDEPEKPFEISDAWRNFILLVGDLSQALLWVLAALVLVLVVLALRRFIPEPRLRGQPWRPPETLFGLQVAPESLPDDVPGAARAAAREGRMREALSLLYRGALSALVHRHEIMLNAGDTEGDCLRAAGRVLPADATAYFGRLVGTWQSAAYAGLLPGLEGIERLCGDWPRHFSEQVPA